MVAPAASSRGGNIEDIRAKVILADACAGTVAAAFTGDSRNAPNMARFVRGGSRLAARGASASGGTGRSKSPARAGAKKKTGPKGNQEIIREAVADIEAHPKKFNKGVDAALAACETAIPEGAPVRPSTVLALAATYSPKFLETAGNGFRSTWVDKAPKNRNFLRVITDDRHKVLNPPFPALRSTTATTKVEKWLETVTGAEITAAGIIQSAVFDAVGGGRMFTQVVVAVAVDLYEINTDPKYGENPAHHVQEAKKHARVVINAAEPEPKAAFAEWRAHVNAAFAHVDADPKTVQIVHYPPRPAEAGGSSAAPAGL